MPIDLEGKNPLQDKSTGTDEASDILHYTVWAVMAGVGLLTGWGIAKYLVDVGGDVLGVNQLKQRGRNATDAADEAARGGGL